MNTPLPSAMQPLVDRLLAFLAQDGCSDAEFDDLAAALFEHQYAHNEPYRRFCQRRGVTPRRVRGWRQVPAVPISAFKDATLSSVPPEDCERVFMTSGTSRGEVKGRNHHPTIAVWDVSMRRHFEQRFLQSSGLLPMLLLFPNEGQLPNSSLARYLSLAARCYGTPDSRSYLGPQGLDVDGLRAALDRAVAQAQAVALMGASFSVVHLLDALREQHRYIITPARSGMNDAELQWMKRVLERYPFPPALLRYAVAAGLNQQPAEAEKALVWLCKIHNRQRCEEGIDSWRAAGELHPALSTVPGPRLP